MASLPASNESLPVRESVSKYEKLKRIGEGTYGVVCEFQPTFISNAADLAPTQHHAN